MKEKKEAIECESKESFLPTPAIKPFVARRLATISYSAMKSFSIELLIYFLIYEYLTYYHPVRISFPITILLIATVHKKVPPTESSLRFQLY